MSTYVNSTAMVTRIRRELGFSQVVARDSMPDMKAGTRIAPVVPAVLLALSSIVAHVAFRFENTLFSYSYMSRGLETVAQRLEPAAREQSARGVINFLRSSGVEVPQRLQPYAYPAAVNGFDAEWYERIGKRFLFNALQCISRESEELSLPLSIHEFEFALLDIARSELGITQYIEIDREVSRMPSVIELTDRIPEAELERVHRWLRSIRPLLLIITYLVPGVIIALCFLLLKIENAFRAVGSGLIAGSIAGVLAVFGVHVLAADQIAAAVGGTLPQYLLWTEPGIEEVVSGILSGLLPTAGIVAMCGAAVFAIGVAIKFRKSRHAD